MYLHRDPSVVSRLLLEIVKDVCHVNVTAFPLTPFQYPELGFLDYHFGIKMVGLTYSNNSAMRRLYTPQSPSFLESF